VNVTKFGAFVNILPGRDGLLHISKIGGGKRIDRVEDVLNLGDAVKVIVREIDDRGKVSLDMADAPSGDDSDGGSDAPREERKKDDRNDRGDRGGRGGGRDRSNDRGKDRGGDRSNDRKRDDKPEAKPGRKVVSFEEEFESGL
jgi:polyribonucleotide nucleotidyltransferase